MARRAPVPFRAARLLAFLAFPFLGPAAAAAFEGRVVREADGEPVAGAIVQILGVPGSVTTDSDGRFTWQPDPAPPFSVLVVLPGDRYTAPVLVSGLEAPLVEIRVAPLSIAESVTITAGAVPHTDATPGAAAAVISGEAIRTRQAPRLADVLEAVPGGARSSDLHAGVPSLRGLSRGRTVLLLDGARITTERRAGASGSFLDPFFLEAVEVVRGPSSVAYGSDAFGGVIHARTRRPVPNAPFAARARATLGAGLPESSFGAEVSGSAFGAGLLAAGRRRVFSEYRSPEGVVPGSGAEDYGFLLRGEREVRGGLLEFGLQVDAGRRIGRPRRTSSFTSYPEEDSTRLSADYRFAPRWGFARLDASVFLGAHRLLTRRDAEGTALNSEVSARDSMFRLSGVRPLGRGRIELGAELLRRFGLGADTHLEGVPDLLLTDLFENLGSRLDGAARSEASVYGLAEAPLAERVSGSVGARISGIAARSGRTFGRPALSESHRAFSGFAALRADLFRGATLAGQVSRGFRDPTLSDRYFAGLSGRGVVIGNPDLRPEKSLQADGSLRFGSGRVHYGLYGFRYRITDLIERFEDPLAPDLYFFRNRGEARISGAEFEMQFGAVGDPFSLDLAAGLARGVAEDGRPLADIPSANMRIGLRRRFRERGFAELVLLAFAGDRRPGPTETTTDAYARLDAAVGVPLAGGAELRLSGRNLLDQAYPISADSRAVLAPGRSVVGSLVWTLAR